jgi:DNA-directed RNA polymerase subunit M/transcription elongation factor TFIIS
MEPEAWRFRACPNCQSKDYQFRNRKKIAGENGAESVETKFRCKSCGHEWRECVAKA